MTDSIDDDQVTNSPEEGDEWPDPTPEMMESDEFNAIWNLMKDWEVHIPDGDHGSVTGNHVRAIIDAINKSRPDTIRSMVKKLKYSALGGSTRQAIVDKLHEAISNTVT